MDYERKYKDALKWMQSLYDGLHGATKEEAEHYFPELKENKSERVRKGLIKTISSLLDNTILYHTDITKEEALAWLEKQGEKKLIENVETKFCEGDKVVSNQDGKVYTVGTAYLVNGDNICLHGTDGNHKWTNEDDLNKNYHLWIDAKKLDADKVIAWLVANILDYEYFVKWFKKDFGL